MIADLPHGWAYAQLPDLIAGDDIFVDGDWVESKDQDPSGDVRLIQLADVGDGLYLNKSKRFMRNARAVDLGCTFLQKGDVLVARMPEPLGRACIFPGDEKPAVTVVDICVIRGRAAHFENAWLMHFINTPAFRAHVYALQSGSTRQRISRGKLSSIRLPVPPRLEQSRIVQKLEELLSDLDDGVADLKAAQAKLEQYRQSLLKSAVEGALTSAWRAERTQHCADAQTGVQLLDHILSERRTRWEVKQIAGFKGQGKPPPKDWQAKYQAPLPPDTTNLPALPNGWTWATVEQLGEVQLGRQRSPDKLKGLNPTKYIRAANITEQGIDFDDVLEMDFSENEKANFELKPGHVLLTEASGSPQHVGRPVIWPDVVGVYCFQNTVIRFIPQGIGSDYAFRIFQAWQRLGKFRQLSGGVGINHLSAGKFSALAIPLPSLAEQQAIVDALAAAFAAIEVQELAIEHSLKQSTAQRKNILNVAFSGQLVPQDPNDEPASKLLDRIRAEREQHEKQPKQRKTKAKKEAPAMASKLIDVLKEAGDWVPAQEAFHRCGIVDGAHTDEIEMLYAELRELDRAKQVVTEPITDAQGRKLSDRLKFVAKD